MVPYYFCIVEWWQNERSCATHRERERGEVLHLSGHTRLMQVLPGHPLAHPKVQTQTQSRVHTHTAPHTAAQGGGSTGAGPHRPGPTAAMASRKAARGAAAAAGDDDDDGYGAGGGWEDEYDDVPQARPKPAARAPPKAPKVPRASATKPAPGLLSNLGRAHVACRAGHSMRNGASKVNLNKIKPDWF